MTNKNFNTILAEALAREKNVPTNADRIRTMTDEELAVWLDDMICDCDCNPVPCREFCKVEDCHEAWLRWLKKEVEE